MPDIIDSLTSPKGEVIINVIACAIFAVLILGAISTERISLGSIPPKIGKTENPRAFWAIISLYGIIAMWTAAKAVSGLF